MDKSFGEYLAFMRKSKLMTQEMLASKLHVSKSAVAKWETDGGKPDRDNIKNLADVLDVTTNELYRRLYRGSDDELEKVALENRLAADMIAVLEKYGYIFVKVEEDDPDAD